MAETSKTYIVNYEINANGAGAIEAFNALVEPVARLQEQFTSIRSSFEGVQAAVTATQKSLQQLSFKPTIELTPFKDALAAMELNAAKTAARIRSIMETSLGGSRAQFDQRMAGVGKGGWIDVKSADTNAVKENAHYSRLLKALQYRSSMLKKINDAKKETFESFAEARGLTQAQKDALRRGSIVSIPYYDSEGKRVGNSMTQLNPTRGKLKQLLEDEHGGKAAARLRDMQRRQRWQSKWLERNYGDGNVHAAVAEANAFLKKNGFEGFAYDKATGEVTSHMGNTGKAFINQLDTQLKQSRAMVRAANKKMAEIRATSLQGTAASPTGDFSGLVTAMNPTGINTMATGISETIKSLKQMPKNGFPLTVKATMTGVAEMSTKLVEMLTSLQTKANSKPIKIKSTIQPPSQADLNKTIKSLVGTKKKPGVAAGANIPFTISGLDAMSAKLTETITALQEIASSKVISIKARLNKPTKTSVEEMKALSQITGGDRTANVTANILGNFTERLVALKEFITLFKAFKSGEKDASVKAKVSTTGLTESAMTRLETFIKVFNKFVSGNKDATVTARVVAPSQAEFDKINKFKSGKSKGMKKSVMIDVAFSANQAQAALSKLKNLTLNAVIKPVWGGMKNKANEMKAIESKIPPIKIRLDISQAKATLNELIANIKAVSNQTIKLSTSASRTINNASSTLLNTATRVRGANAPPASTRPITMSRPTAAPQGRSWNRILYPLTGNTSLGATTPAAISMAKGFGVMYAVGGAMSGISSAMSQSVDYQNTMETARAILGRNYKGGNFERDFGNMERIARKVGMDTKYTAPDVANATRFMAMAGLDIPTINHSLRPIADISLIGDNDLAEVADKMTNIQTAFGVHGSKMRNLANQMTNTFTQSNTDMMMIAETMQYAAPMAHAAGANVGDVLAMVGTMGNVGIQASSAGTTLRMMYQNILKPNKPQLATWNKLGIKREDENGAPRNMIDILQDVANNKYVNDNNIAKVLTNMFRTTSVAGAIAVVQDLRKNDSLTRKLREENSGTGINGLSESISERKQNTIQGLWAQVTSAFTEDNLQVFEEFQGFIKEVLTSLRDFMRSKEAIDALRSVWSIIKDIADVMGQFARGWLWLFSGFTGKIAKFFIIAQFAMQQVGALLAPVKGVINVLGGLKEALFGVSVAGAAAGFVKGGSTIATSNGILAAMATRDAIAGIQSPDNPARTNIPPVQSAYFAKGASYPIASMPWAVVAPRKTGVNAMNNVAMMASLSAIDNTIASLQASPRKLSKKQKAMLENALATRATLVAPLAKSESIEKAYQLRRVQQLNNMALMNRYINRYGRDNANPAIVERFDMIRDERRKAKSAGWMTVKEQRLSVLRNASAQRRIEQLSNEALVRRYERMYGANMAVDAATAFGIYREAAYKRNAPLRALRRPAQLQNAALLARGGTKFIGAGMANAFNAGTAAMSMAGMGASIKTGLTSTLLGLSKGFGMLLSPVGMVTTALVALGVVAWKLYDTAKKTREKLEKIEKSYNAPNANTEAAKKFNSNRTAKFVDYADHATSGGTAKYKSLAQRAGTKDLFNDPKHTFNKYTMADIYLGGRKNLAPGDTFDTVRKKSALAALEKLGANSATANHRYIAQLYEKAQGKGPEAFKEAKKQALAYAEKFNPARNPNLKSAADLTTDQIGNITQVRDYKEWYQGLYNSLLQDARGTSVWTSKISGISELKSGVQAYSNDWWNAMGKTINGMKVSFETCGRTVDLTLKSLPTGRIDPSSVIAQVQKMVQNFKLNISEFAKMSANVYAMLVSSGLASGKYYSDWMKFTQAQTEHQVVTSYDAGSYYDKYIGSKGWNGMNRQQYIDYVTNSNNKGDAAKERVRIRKTKANKAAIDAKRNYDKQQRALQAPVTPGANNTTTTTNGDNTPENPINPLGDINDGYENNYDRHTGRPTQIVINIDKLANFDKSQFLTADQQKMAMMVQDSVSQGLMQLIPQINYALGAVNTNSGN